MRTSTFVGLLGSMASMAAFIGCSGEEDIAARMPGVKSGTLEQSWTIEGVKDPMKCQQYGADRMRLVVFDAKGKVHASRLAKCTAFQETLELQTGTYSGNATFVDTAEYPVSRSVSIPQFVILDDRRLPISLDFTARDMVAPQ